MEWLLPAIWIQIAACLAMSVTRFFSYPFFGSDQLPGYYPFFSGIKRNAVSLYETIWNIQFIDFISVFVA